MSHIMPEEELIAYAKPYLKSRGFKKRNKRWTKDIGEFTMCFYIQGSSFSKENYYIRPGIFVNALMPTTKTYGHWMFEIEKTTPENVMTEFEKWCGEWTNKTLIRNRLEAFIEWEKRNPVEKRRAGLVDYAADPVPAEEFFGIDIPSTEVSVSRYILDNF